jgi:hypothetical protein
MESGCTTPWEEYHPHPSIDSGQALNPLPLACWSHSPAEVTYGEQVEGEEYEAEEIAALRSQRLRRIATWNLP